LTPPRGAVDPEIVGRARGGDREALEALLRALTPGLLRLAARLSGGAGSSEELVTEALYRGAVKLRRLRDPAAAESWFRRILVNLWRDSLRRRRREELFLSEVPEPCAPVSFDPSAEVEAAEAGEALARAMAALPAGQRAVAALHIEEGLPVGEIAEALGTTPERVKANLWHARQRLRALLGRFLGDRSMDGDAADGA